MRGRPVPSRPDHVDGGAGGPYDPFRLVRPFRLVARRPRARKCRVRSDRLTTAATWGGRGSGHGRSAATGPRARRRRLLSRSNQTVWYDRAAWPSVFRDHRSHLGTTGRRGGSPGGSVAQLVMDFHAHLAKTEVIGLLGGLFDPEHRRLHVRTVFPCNSLSTGLQVRPGPAPTGGRLLRAHVPCTQRGRSIVSGKRWVSARWIRCPRWPPGTRSPRMDAKAAAARLRRRSEADVQRAHGTASFASVRRLRQGYLTVGWYHSHPTFVPDPSVRDIENQSVYQVRPCPPRHAPCFSHAR